MLYSINKYGTIIEIEELAIRKVEFFEAHHGIWKSRNDASLARLEMERVNQSWGIGEGEGRFAYVTWGKQ